MQTEEIVQINFKKDLRELLKKYDAEIDVEVDMLEYGADVKGISFYIPRSYDIDGEILREETVVYIDKWNNWETV